MVCPDATLASGFPVGLLVVGAARCVGLAGGSPAAVSAGAPRSRLQPPGEIPSAERSVESPCGSVRTGRGKQSCGPSMKRTLQPRDRSPRKGGMAEPVMSRRRQQTAPGRSGGVQDVPGVGRRARSDSPTRNRRDPPRQPTSGKDPGYKPTAKCQGAGRESEGPIVLLMPGESRAEGRGPALVTSVRGGKCEGMVERPNTPLEQARGLRGGLFMSAECDHRRPLATFSVRLDWGDDPDETWRRTRDVSCACGMRRPSVSRVREIRTHGWKGDLRKRSLRGHRA